MITDYQRGDPGWEEGYYAAKVNEARQLTDERLRFYANPKWDFSPEKCHALREEVVRRWAINEAFEIGSP
jgi:hypothetical protein